MTVTALYLTLLAAGVWHQEDHEDWRRDLRWLIWSLVPDDQVLDELPAEAFDHLYALLAVAMTTLRHDTLLHGGREADVLATEAWRDASEWVADADPELAEQRLLPPANLSPSWVALVSCGTRSSLPGVPSRTRMPRPALFSATQASPPTWLRMCGGWKVTATLTATPRAR
jgi:hypothetical protein